MRPKRYPYSKLRVKEVGVDETRLPFSQIFRIIEIQDSWTGEVLDYRREIIGEGYGSIKTDY